MLGLATIFYLCVRVAIHVSNVSPVIIVKPHGQNTTLFSSVYYFVLFPVTVPSLKSHDVISVRLFSWKDTFVRRRWAHTVFRTAFCECVIDLSGYSCHWNTLMCFVINIVNVSLWHSFVRSISVGKNTNEYICNLCNSVA